jgi:fibronectin-binding autotransporter adhesin
MYHHEYLPENLAMAKSPSSRRPALAAVLIGFSFITVIAAPPARADSVWNVSAGNWSVATNWSGGQPTSDSTAYIVNGGTATVSTTNAVCGTLSLGGSAASGTVLMSGSSLNATQVENVGDSGKGTFTQSNGTNSIGVFLTIGNNAGSSGAYNLSGGLLSALNEIVGFSGVGIFTQTGGTNQIADNHQLILGNNDGGSGTYNLSGNALLLASDELVGYGGNGIFTQTGGTNAISNHDGDNLTLGQNYVSGTYNLNGGRLILPALFQGTGTAVLNISGGTLQANRAFSTVVPIVLGTSGGGATLDTAGFSVAISGSVSGTGGLTKIGGGELTLNGTDSYTGNTLVKAGTLVLASNTAITNGTSLAVGAGATLVFDSMAAAAPAVVPGGAGAVPEPSSFALLGAAALGLLCYVCRR